MARMATFPQATTQQRHWRWLLIGFAFPLFGGIATYNLVGTSDNDAALAPVLNQDIVANLEPAPSSSTVEPEAAAPEPVGDSVDFIVRRNDTLERIFRRLQLSLADLAEIRDLPDIGDKLDAIRPGDLISIVHVDGALQQLVRRLSDTQALSVIRDTSGFTVKVIETPLDIRIQHVHGHIESSLFAAARAAGVSSDIIMRLANDIFGWDIDFALEIQPGDTFTIVYEKKYRDGEYLGDGRILAAEFINDDRTYRAIRFDSTDGKIGDYFAPDGRSMRKQFLRAPLDFTRISSNFNPRRRHPILNTIRAHQGVDYAAPTGTPIKAAGDGRVDFVGRKGGYGNAIILGHGGAISTLYGHMSHFAKNLRTGMHVKQGQTIGYVGSTGAATGPHLHYEYRVNGMHKNPRTVQLPDAQPIPPSYRAEFDSQRGALLAQLDSAKAATVAALP